MKEIFYNGKIVTMAGDTEMDEKYPEAVYVKDGYIEATGELSELCAAAGDDVKKTDLEGACLLPGFIDGHSHFVMAGQMACYADLSGCNSFNDIKQVMCDYINEQGIKAGGTAIGFAYDHNFLEEKAQPDKRLLDQISTDIKILILHVSLHLACANSAALEFAGITDGCEDIEGGFIQRIEGTSEPTGYLEEAAMHLVKNVLEKTISLDLKQLVPKMQEIYLKYGITTVQDGLTTAEDFEFLKQISADGSLKVDVVSYPHITAGGCELLHANEEYTEGYINHVKIGGYKIVLDGSPQGRSAWMRKPYLGGNPDYCAYPWQSDEKVYECVKTAVIEGHQILAHCNGDAASEQLLNAYEKALREVKQVKHLRPVMIHCQTVGNDQLDRMAKIKMIASVFVGHVWYWGDVHVKNFGPERGHHISPSADALKRGLIVNYHQDYPVTVPDMMHSVWCSVNRISRGGNVIGEDQKTTVYDALKAITINGAYSYFEEDSKGTIEAGKRADFCILEESPLEVDKLRLKDIKVLRSIKDGKVVYGG